jgi:integrase
MAKPNSISIRGTLDPFRKYLKAQRKAEATVINYVGYIRRMADDLDMPGAKPTLVYKLTNTEITEAFCRYDSASQHNYCLASLRAWLRWCVRNQYITQVAVDRAMDGFEHAKEVRKPKLYIPAERFPEMLEIAGARHPRNRMAVALALFTFARQSEISPMELAHVDRGDQMIKIYRHKTGRYTDCGISLDLEYELDLYLDWYAKNQGYADAGELIAAHPDWYLVPRLEAHGPNPANAKMLPGTPVVAGLEGIFKFVLDEMDGIEPNHGRSVRWVGEGMHTLRRSGARALFLCLLESGAADPKGTVQTMLDHDDPKQTLRYIGIDLEKMRVNNWLKGNSMFGLNRPESAGTPGQDTVGGATVISIASLRGVKRENTTVTHGRTVEAGR